jgi:hypothetical protein
MTARRGPLAAAPQRSSEGQRGGGRGWRAWTAPSSHSGSPAASRLRTRSLSPCCSPGRRAASSAGLCADAWAADAATQCECENKCPNAGGSCDDFGAPGSCSAQGSPASGRATCTCADARTPAWSRLRSPPAAQPPSAAHMRYESLPVIPLAHHGSRAAWETASPGPALLPPTPMSCCWTPEPPSPAQSACDELMHTCTPPAASLSLSTLVLDAGNTCMRTVPSASTCGTMWMPRSAEPLLGEAVCGVEAPGVMASPAGGTDVQLQHAAAAPVHTHGDTGGWQASLLTPPAHVAQRRSADIVDLVT